MSRPRRAPSAAENAGDDATELAARLLSNTPDVAAVVELADGRVASFAGVDQRDADRIAALARALVPLVPADGQLHVRTARGQVFLSQYGERLLVAMTARRVQAASVLYDLHMAVRGELGE